MNDEPSVRIAGSWRITVRTSRLAYRGLFACGSTAALLSARFSLASNPFTQFVVPLLCGAFVGLLIHPVPLTPDEQDDPIHVPELLAKVGGAVFLSVTLARFLPSFTTGAWIGWTGGVLLLAALSLFDESRRAQRDRRIGP